MEKKAVELQDTIQDTVMQKWVVRTNITRINEDRLICAAIVSSVPHNL